MNLPGFAQLRYRLGAARAEQAFLAMDQATRDAYHTRAHGR
jgi:hypothetical protein